MALYPDSSWESPALEYTQRPFQTLDIYAWSPQDCGDWASSVCRRRGLDQNAVDLCSFRNTTGVLLLQFSLQDFCTLVGDDVGRLFYQDFRAQIKKRRANYMESSEDGYTSHYGMYSTSDRENYSSWVYTTDDIRALDQYIFEERVEDNTQGFELPGQLMPVKYGEHPPFNQPVEMARSEATQPPLDVTTGGAEVGVVEEMGVAEEFGVGAGADGCSAEGGAVASLLYPITSRRKRTRGPKVWEFLVRLLLDPSTNPSLIAWEDREAGTFRLVEKEKIAALWIKRSGSGSLSYSNFARTIRHHYGTGNILPTDRQLVFGLGAAAWDYLNRLRQDGSAFEDTNPTQR
ncbi:uncharacterized protein LOC125039717 [Penaeus chinensis]|uniref:uncharacterized protein LOC125039717 n=1 Tax=Penaeus chinensis TaxID=139456 RepID=UPI001FB7C110|nr:uncharacterized protein LOC125039717 [Penaeus chinensis]